MSRADCPADVPAAEKLSSGYFRRRGLSRLLDLVQSTQDIGENPTLEHPVRMLSSEDEDEIERMYQKLKTVGRLDSSGADHPSKTSDED